MVRRTEKRQAASRFPRTHARRHTYDVLARPNEAAAVQVLGQPVAPDDPVRGDSSARGAALSSRKEGGRGRGERGGQRSGFREGFEGARARCGSRRGCQRGEGGRCPGPDRARHAPSLSRSLALSHSRASSTHLSRSGDDGSPRDGALAAELLSHVAHVDAHGHAHPSLSAAAASLLPLGLSLAFPSNEGPSKSILQILNSHTRKRTLPSGCEKKKRPSQ